MSDEQILSRWLYVTAAAVFAMVVIGAITRLTESGLSMVEWKPLIGAIPPLNQAQWDHVFDLYKQTPEFQKKNFWMELSDFQTIFFWEWLHRLWGRLIGVIYALPLVYFWITKQIPAVCKMPLLGILVLGGLQGGLGWYMVKSGLVDIPEVSHYRLAAHLGLAFVIFAALIWNALCLSKDEIKQFPSRVLFNHGLIVLIFYAFTVCWGAYTAGLDAGLIYNEFPMMGGDFLPPDLWHLQPWWINFLENPAAVQFTHRWLAISLFVMIGLWWGHARIRKNTFPLFHLLMVMVCAQAGLGIVTLLSGVDIVFAVLHQAAALVLLLLQMMVLFALKPEK